MNDINEILADVKQEGDTDPFANLEKETPSDSPAENKPEEDKPVETPQEGEVKVDEPLNTPEDNIPFHKHPRWIETRKELEDLRAFKESVEPRLSEFEQVKESMEKKSTNEEIPDWFVELYGENAAAWSKYSAREAAREEAIEQRAIERLERKQQEKQLEDQKWVKFVDEGFSSLESQGKKFNRNELANFMLENPITDGNNNLDFAKSYALFEKLNPPKEVNTQAKKELADTMAKSSAAQPKSKDYMTPAELRGKSWNQL